MGKFYKMLFLVIILKISEINAWSRYYCNIEYCEHRQEHTLCRYLPNQASLRCGLHIISQGFNNQEKQQIVFLHNKLRQMVASGLETKGNPGPQPAATFMSNLTWDSELELIAQTWANQCPKDHPHDKCRDVERFPVGQNVFLATWNSFTDYSIEKPIQVWYDEVAYFDNRLVDNYQFQENTGHYTALIWATTTKIGCGRIKFPVGSQFGEVFVCNYGPSGNILDYKIYEAIR